MLYWLEHNWENITDKKADRESIFREHNIDSWIRFLLLRQRSEPSSGSISALGQCRTVALQSNITDPLQKYLSFYIIDADIVVLVYDMSNEAAHNKVSSWLDEAVTNCPEYAQIMIVGNKIDLTQ